MKKNSLQSKSSDIRTLFYENPMCSRMNFFLSRMKSRGRSPAPHSRPRFTLNDDNNLDDSDVDDDDDYNSGGDDDVGSCE